MKHRRGVHSGAVCAGAASSSDGTDERAGGGADIWAFARDGAQDVEVFFAAWLSSSTPIRRPKLEAYIAVIDQILELDKSIHRKQQHSVKRIFERLRDEHGYLGGYTVVKDYVREQKQRRKEMFVPLKHAPGRAQVDFGEADIYLNGVLQRAHFFVMDLPHSDDAFVMAFPAETTEAFCEGHSQAFAYFSGVPQTILYDNTKIAVAQILGDGTRQKTRAFSELQSHYLFAERFGRPGKGNDKGKVEGLVGYARRNFLVPQRV